MKASYLKDDEKLSREWHDERDISDFKTNSTYQAKWKCTKNDNHIWTTPIRLRFQRGYGCPYCANRKVLVGDNDLSSTHPHLVSEWFDERDITTITSGSRYQQISESAPSFRSVVNRCYQIAP